MESSENINFIFQFNNKSRSANFFVLYIVSGAIFLAAICIFIFLNMNLPLITSVLLAIAYFVIFHQTKPSYFELLVTETELQINFYSVATALKNYQTVLIQLNQLKSFEIKKKMLGLKKELILTVDSKFGLADYPPISVSILKKGELAQLYVVLSKIINLK
ncbi:MAG TPA: hypothetical protein PKH79_05070 [Prolixibacteraceae bacterium]|nr:hypothetical protein [Prolixibacteraceae bacterium]HPS12003.1 hypothetical protein [Prolixibacteraceae bacterium]